MPSRRLPAADAAGIATGVVHDRVGGWNRTTVRHALRELVRQGRAGFTGRDRRRRYHRGGGIAPPPEPERQARPNSAAPRGEGEVLLPDARGVEFALRRLQIRYRDIDASQLLREERLAGWGWHKRSSAELTRAVFGDPEPGRVRLERRGRTESVPDGCGLSRLQEQPLAPAADERETRSRRKPGHDDGGKGKV